MKDDSDVTILLLVVLVHLDYLQILQLDLKSTVEMWTKMENDTQTTYKLGSEWE